MMSEPFDLIADEYQRLHGANPHQMRALADLADVIPPASSVLDLGCGTGLPTAQFLTARGHQLTGVDTSTAMLAKARVQVPSAQFDHADMTALTFEASSFDAITAFFSLLMLSQAEIATMVERISSWLRPGGFFALGMVDFEADSVDVDFMGVRFKASGLRREALDGLAVSCGLDAVWSRAVVHEPEDTSPEKQIFALYRRPA